AAARSESSASCAKKGLLRSALCDRCPEPLPILSSRDRGAAQGPQRASSRPGRAPLSSSHRNPCDLVLRRPLESTQYLSIRYTERLAEAGIELSVGSKGDSYDNALAETIIGLFKTEVIHRQGPWRGFEDVEFATLNWVWSLIR